MEGQREHWNDVYSNNESYFGTEMSPFGKMSLEFLKGKDVKDVLELGPGQGRDSLGFVMNGYNLTGLDCSNVACGILKERIPGMKVRLGDVRDGIDFPPESFDACYAHMVLIMDMTPGDIRRTLKSACKVLRPGGYLLFSVRNTDDPGFGKGVNTHHNVWENEQGFAVNYFTEEEIRSYLTEFEILDVKRFTEGPKNLFGIFLRKK
ncbi:MAG: class I SAM-dependent methyltransferase [Candidatus Methanomethylophilaceae archaeon]|nr:class I SAM-dependent methyltransferase [Candidatus Methanomethylophilaceae archaeon]